MNGALFLAAAVIMLIENVDLDVAIAWVAGIGVFAGLNILFAFVSGGKDTLSGLWVEAKKAELRKRVQEAK